MNNFRVVEKTCECVEEECQICFKFKDMVKQYYNHRTCFDCWKDLVFNHVFQELGLDQLFYNKDFPYNKNFPDLHSKLDQDEVQRH